MTTPVDMSEAAINARIRELSELTERSGVLEEMGRVYFLTGKLPAADWSGLVDVWESPVRGGASPAALAEDEDD